MTPSGGRGTGDRREAWVRGLAAVVTAGVAALAACGGDGGMEPNPGPTPLDLAPGEDQVVRPSQQGDELALSLPAPDGDTEYRLAVQSAAKGPGATAMRLDVSTDGGTSTTSSSVRGADPGAGAPPALPDPLGHLARQQLQRGAFRMLQRRGVRPARRGGGGLVRTETMLPTGQTPATGDTLRFWFSVQSDGSTDCDTTQAEKVTGVVQASEGHRVAMVEDTAVDDGDPLGGMDYEALATEFDQSVFAVNAAYFGDPTDIDGNQRVLVLFTNRVNEFSAQRTGGDGGGVVAGLFNPVDMADSGDDTKDGTGAIGVCEASNEAEVMWLLAPDPDGSTGETATVEDATRFARSTSAHEFEHMLNTGNRVIKAGGTFNEVEETWLDEGLAHLAEEVVGLKRNGSTLRQNLAFADVTGSASEDSTFNIFLLPDFANFARYMQSPTATRALALSDPQNTDATLRMRGSAWGFLRWLADQEAPASGGGPDGLPGSGEELMFRELAAADGSLETGVANIEAATGKTWANLLADFGLALTADDDVAGASQRVQFLTWDLRDIYAELNTASSGSFPFDRPYPLVPTAGNFAAGSFDFSAQAATGRYFVLTGDASSPGLVLEVTDQTGSPLQAGSPQVTILRVQ